MDLMMQKGYEHLSEPAALLSLGSDFFKLLSHDDYPAMRSPPLTQSAIMTFKIVNKKAVFCNLICTVILVCL